MSNDRTDADIDVLVMTMDRPTELATTLAGLAGQQHDGFRVLVSDRSAGAASFDSPAAHALARVLEIGGRTAVLEEFR